MWFVSPLWRWTSKRAASKGKLQENDHHHFWVCVVQGGGWGKGAPCSVRAAPCAVLGARCSVRGALCAVLCAPCSVRGALCSVLCARCSVIRALCVVLRARCSVSGASCAVLCARCSVRGASCAVLCARCSVRRALAPAEDALKPNFVKHSTKSGLDGPKV